MEKQKGERRTNEHAIYLLLIIANLKSSNIAPFPALAWHLPIIIVIGKSARSNLNPCTKVRCIAMLFGAVDFIEIAPKALFVEK
jgi:hypothetical protein